MDLFCNLYIRTNRTSGLSSLMEPIFPFASRSRSGKQSLPAMLARASYKYSPLKGQQIRLLTLLPGKLNSRIRVRLHTTILSKDDVPAYEALSYTWGSADGPIDLFVDISRRSDQSLPMTQNLECALQHLRYIHKPRILWIDAICVNQQDLPERSKQVARMADIYTLAKEVLVWLGPEADNSTSALETLRNMGNLVEIDFAANTMSPSSNARYRDEIDLSNPSRKLLCTAERYMPIHLLFGRPWFERLWIQQEIRLATSAIIVCGFQTLPWPVFARASAAMWGRLIDDKEFGNHAASFEERRSHINSLCTGRLYSDFEDLLNMTKKCKCTDPRDRVYALLNLSEFNYGIVPNYEKSVIEVYKDMFVASMKKQQPGLNLKLLAACGMWESAEELPSWVPDWSPEKKCLPLRNQAACGATGFSNADALVLDGNVLRVMGMEVAHIGGVVQSQLDEASTLIDFISFIRVIFPRDMLSHASAEARLDALCRVLCSNSFSDYSDPPSGSSEPLLLPDWKKSKEGLKMVVQEEWGRKLMLNEDVWVYLNHAFQFVKRRALFSITSGEIGLGPSAATAGDVIAVLPGCPSPMVLRPVYTAEWSAGVPAKLHSTATIYGNPILKGYKVVGECCLDKLTKRAAILGPLPEDYELVIRLVKEQKALFNAYLNRRSGEFQLKDPRFEKLRSERGSDGKRRFFVREGPILGAEGTTSTHVGGEGIRMRVSELDDEEVLVMGIDLKPFDLL